MGFLTSGGGAGVRGCLEWSAIVYMSSGMFRGKQSSNRIELSRLVQDLLNFGVLGSLQLWGWGVGGWEWGVVGGCLPHMCKCMRMHARTSTRGKHDNIMQMAAPVGGIPGNSLWCHMHMHVCAHGWGAPSHHPPLPSTHPHPQGDPRNHSKFNSTWTSRNISILFEDLKSVETPQPMGGCIIWWVGGRVDGWGQVKSLKIWKLLTEPRKFNSVWRFMICRDTPLTHPPMRGCLGGWVGQFVNRWGQVKWLTIE